MIVAVDGPSGAGKSTVCRTVAQSLGFSLLDTGALYRCVALLAGRGDVELNDAERLGEIAARLEVVFEPGGERVWLNGEDVTTAIRTHDVSSRVSPISAHPSVRDALLDVQRGLGKSGQTIVEGRDIGTVVFPDADLKVYFTASSASRARRRCEELENRGETVDYEAVLAAIEARDERDSQREVAPLTRAADAVLLDTTELNFDQACDALATLIQSASPALKS